MSNLKNRRQFLFTNQPMNIDHNWNELKVTNQYSLYYDQDLDIAIAENGQVKLVGIGILADPYNTMLNNEEILQGILNNTNSFTDLYKNTFSISGRWALVYIDGNEISVFNDACGMKQIYYLSNNGNYILSSSPNLLAKHLNLSKNIPTDMKEFIETKQFERSERAWIGEKTIFENVYKLLPNHYLDLQESSVNHFEPGLVNLSIDKQSVLDKINNVIKGTLKSLSSRYDLMQAVTAGWDSRLLLVNAMDLDKQFQPEFFVSDSLSI